MLGIRNPEQGRKQMISQNIRKNKGHVHYKYLIFHSTKSKRSSEMQKTTCNNRGEEVGIT